MLGVVPGTMKPRDDQDVSISLRQLLGLWEETDMKAQPYNKDVSMKLHGPVEVKGRSDSC